MRLQVLGPVRAWRDDDVVDLGPAGQRAVLGLLALAGGQPMSRADLVNALWGEHPPPSATNMIQSRVKHLRRTLEPDRRSYMPSAVLPTVGDGYALELSGVDLDLSRFRSLLANANAARRRDDFRQVSALLAEALQLWHGSPLADLPVLAAYPKVVTLADQRRTALAQYGEALLATGAVVEALPALEEVAAAQPVDEAAWARLIHAYRAAGRRAQAFATYHEMRRRLADELGVDPGADLAAAHAALLHDDGAAPVAASTAVMPADTPAAASGGGAADEAAPAGWPADRRRPRPAQLPADVAGFTGRDTELRRLDELLEAAPDSAMAPVFICAVLGTAGVGKTALAVRWAHRVRDRFTDGQLYANLRGFDAMGAALKPAEVMQGFLDAFGLPPQQMPASLEALTGLYRSVLADKRILIVLDNARDAEQVRPLLPGAPGCLVVITSRNRLSSLVAAEGARPVALDVLSVDESRQLLARRLGADRIGADPSAVGEIIDACARLPLALTIVAARIATDPGLALAELAGQLRGARSTLDALAGEDPSTDARAVFSLSYQALGDRTATLFRLLGLLPGSDVTVAAAASLAGVPMETARAQLGELARAHLVAMSTPGRYRMHDLLRAYAAERTRDLDPEPRRQAAMGRMLDYYLHTAHAAAILLDPYQEAPALEPPEPGVTSEPLTDHAAALDWLATEHSSLVRTVEQAGNRGWDTYAWRLAWALEEFLNRCGRFADWVVTQRTALTAGERLADPAVRARAHRGLARAYARLGEHESAHAHFDAALDLFTALADVAGQAQTLLGTSFTWAGLGEYRKALSQGEHALTLYRTAGDQRGQAATLNMIGYYLTALGDHGPALSHCQQALALNQAIGDRRGEADASDSLGYVHHRRGEYAEATACYRHALSRYREVGARQYEADTLAKLGESQMATGDTHAARSSWREALALLDELGHTAFVDCDADKIRASLGLLDRSTLAGGPGAN
ncbi:BTAD domain-containing putative transcriptional regulator [Actinomycetes bacterium KLBMP 9797]